MQTNAYTIITKQKIELTDDQIIDIVNSRLHNSPAYSLSDYDLGEDGKLLKFTQTSIDDYCWVVDDHQNPTIISQIKKRKHLLKLMLECLEW